MSVVGFLSIARLVWAQTSASGIGGSVVFFFFFMLDLSSHSHVVSFLDTKLTLHFFSLSISIIEYRRKNSRVRLSVRGG